MSFGYRLLPAPVDGGFAMDDYWVWCGSTIHGEDGRYHLFASRWPHTWPFFNGYACYSEIVRAVADNPLGPFVFAEVVLGARDLAYWDGAQTHNPHIHRIGDRYCLFYQGLTFPDGMPTEDAVRNLSRAELRTSYPAIGVATAPTLTGPWTRRDEPILAQRDGQWDREVVTNPAVVQRPDGGLFMYYRSYALTIGLAAADAPEGPWQRVGDQPLAAFQPPTAMEDMFVWHNGREYELIAKDLTPGGSIAGQRHAGLHATSRDGIDWSISSPARAYSRTIAWDNGTTTTQGCVERPQLLIENGRPICLYAATGDGPGGFDNCTRTWNVAIPLAKA